MPTHEPFLRFLDLQTEDFDFLDRYRPILLQGAGKFAESFYEYLFGKPETAEVLQSINGKKLAALLEKQTTVPWPMPSEELGKFMAEQIPKWNKIIDDAGIKLKQ